jgi:hypothetical protein
VIEKERDRKLEVACKLRQEKQATTKQVAQRLGSDYNKGIFTKDKPTPRDAAKSPCGMPSHEPKRTRFPQMA